MCFVNRGRLALLVAAVLLSAALPLPPVAAAPVDETTSLRDEVLRLNDVTGEDAIRGQVLALLGEPTHAKKLLAEAVPLAKLKPTPLQINATYILARTAQGLRDYEAGSLLYRLNAKQALDLRSLRGVGRAYEGLSILLFENKKYEDCEQLCREILELPVPGADPEDPTGEKGKDPLRIEKSRALQRLILVLARQEKIDDALKIVDALVKDQPDNWLVLELKGRVLREAGKNAEAVKLYEEVLEHINKDKDLSKEERTDLVNEVRYILSGVYVDMNQIDKAAELLKGLLAQKPDDPTFNNDLGYIWADHDMNLAESEKLIRKAIDEDRKQRRKKNPDLKPEDDKENSAYLDSLGWVLYKQRKFEEARKYLLQAIEDKDGQHIEILDHLADVHLALNEKDKAVAAWKKGLEVVGDSKREQQRKAEVQKKLKANQ